MSYDVFNILIGKGYVWIRNTSNISVLSEYLCRIVISSYVYSAYCFVCRNGYLLDVPKRGNSNCVGQDYCETPLCDVQIANSINRRARGEQSSIQDFVR